MTQPAQPAFVVPYGATIGRIIALLVLIAVLVFYLTNQMEGREAALIGALALAVVLGA